MEILTLLKANIRYKKGSFISVLILTFIISLCLTTVVSLNYNINKRANNALKDVNTGDLVTIIWDIKCPEEMLQKTRNNQYVDHIEVKKVITQGLEINGIKQGSSVFFTAFQGEENPYKIYRKDGLSFEKHPKELQSGEIYVPISFKQKYECKIGDEAYFSGGTTGRTFTIKGFFEEPFIGADMIGIKLALMNEEDFNDLYSIRCQSEQELKDHAESIIGYNFVNLFQKKGSGLTVSEFKKNVNNDSGLIDFAFITISKEQSRSFTVMLIQIFSTIMAAFLLLLFIVVLIVMGHSISTGIEMDYTNLGVLKAIGYSKGMLRKIFVIEYLMAEVIGAALGMAGSIPAIYFLNSIFIRITGLLSSVDIALGSCLFIMAAVILISAFFIFLKTKAIIKVSPVRAISGGKDSIYFRNRLEIPIEGSGLNLKMAIRQLTSNLKQYISSTLIVAILVFFLVAISELNSSMNKETIEESFGGIYYDLEVQYGSPEDLKTNSEKFSLQEKVENEIEKISPIKNTYKIMNQYFTVNGDEYMGTLYSDPSVIKSILKGRTPSYENEIVITEIVSKELGVQMGETVTIATDDKEAKYVISGIFQCTNDMGRAFAMSIDGAKKIIPSLNIYELDYVLGDSGLTEEIANLLNEKFTGQIEAKNAADMNDFEDTVTSSLNIMNIFIYIISVLFAFVVIMIVCGKIFLKEQMDYGIYKALGFTSRTLRVQFALRFVMVALIGSILGLVANVSFNNILMSSILSNIGITSYTSRYKAESLMLPVLAITICFFVFAYLVSRKIKRVDTKKLICEE